MSSTLLSYWPVRFLIMLICGGALSLTMQFAPKMRTLQMIGVLPYLSPNWLSVWRAPIVALGMVIVMMAPGEGNQFYAGYILVVIGLTLDRNDGMVAAALIKRLRPLPHVFLINPDNPTLTSDGQVWAWWEHEEKGPDGKKTRIDQRVYIEEWLIPLTRVYTFMPMFKMDREVKDGQECLRLKLTGIGEWLDPMIDKVNFHPFFIYLAVVDTISWSVALTMIGLDLVSTIFREPFDKLPGTRYLQRFVRQTKASWAGKIKVICQFVTLLSIIPVRSGWLSASEHSTSLHITNGLLIVAIVAGLLSIVTRLTLMDYLLKWRELRRLNRRLRKSFEHDFEGE